MSEERAGTELPEDDDLAMLEDLLEPESDELEPDESEDLPEAETEDEPPPEPRRRPSARQRAVLRLRDRQSKLEEENRNLRQVMERLSQTQPPQSQPDPYRQAEMDRQEEERVAQLMPHQQAQYFARKAKDEMSGELMRARIEVADYLDRQSFDMLKQREPAASRLASKIEDALAQERRLGRNPTREALYNQLFATEIRAKAQRAAETQRKRGRAQIAAQTTQPGSARSSASPTRRRQDDEAAGLDDRLRKVTVGDVW